jgi:hypothetical protein
VSGLRFIPAEVGSLCLVRYGKTMFAFCVVDDVTALGLITRVTLLHGEATVRGSLPPQDIGTPDLTNVRGLERWLLPWVNDSFVASVTSKAPFPTAAKARAFAKRFASQRNEP